MDPNNQEYGQYPQQDYVPQQDYNQQGYSQQGYPQDQSYVQGNTTYFDPNANVNYGGGQYYSNVPYDGSQMQYPPQQFGQFAPPDQIIQPTGSGTENPVLALAIGLIAIFIFFLTGISHILIGQTEKGIVFFLVRLIAILIAYVLSCIYVFIWLAFIIHIVNMLFALLLMIDSYQLAKKLENGQPIYKGECTNGIVAALPKLFLKNLVVFVPGQ